MSYVGAAGSVARVEAVDIASDVAKGEIAELDAELFGRAALPALPWSTYVCSWSVIAIDEFLVPKALTWVMKTGKVTL